MGSVNSPNYNIDASVRIFDKFYAYEVNVPAQEYDAVFSFFSQQFGTKEAAGNMTVSLFRIAEQSGIAVMNLLQSLESQTPTELTLTLAYYLNGLRSNSTLLGLNAQVTPNFYAARNVRS